MNRWIVSGAFIALSGSAAAADRFVGVVEGFPGEVRVAVVAEESQWLVYICADSDRTNAEASRWWKGMVRDGEFAASSDGATLTAKAEGGVIVGEVQTENGGAHAFTAKKVPFGARAGAYRAETSGSAGVHVIGWIVDGDGMVVGCNKSAGNRVALKPAKLAPPSPKSVVRRKPKVAEDAEPEAVEEKAVKKAAKAPVKETEEDAEEADAEPKAAADADDEAEEAVGEKVTSATKPAKGRPAVQKKVVKKAEAEDEDEGSANKPVGKKKPAEDDDE